MQFAFYNPADGQVTATLEGERDAVPQGETFVEIPAGFDLDEDPAAWRVDPATLAPVRAGRAVEIWEVNAERDRRIAAGFAFAGHLFDFDADSAGNITDAGSSAGLYIAMGGDPQSLRWMDPDEDFVFLSAKNLPVPMSAQACLDFGRAALRHKKAHIFAARAIKDQDPIPEDFAESPIWP